MSYFNITCCQCKMVFGMPQDFYNSMKQLAEKGTFFCPAGHTQHFCSGESELDKMRRRAERAEQEKARLNDRIREEREERQAVERKNIATRGVVTRMRNRAANGVCLCCNRTFSNLQKHMETKHPQFKKEDAA